MNVLSLIGQIFKPAAKLIDDLHTSEEEKLKQKAILLELQSKFLTEALAYEQEQMKAKMKIIVAEARSGNLLASSWRPVTMYTFLVMLVSYWFGWIDVNARITPEILAKVFTLLQIGLGGYIASRGVEKVVPAALEAMKKKDET